MVVWLKLEDGRAMRLTDLWTPSIFVAGEDRSELEAVAEREEVRPRVSWSGFVPRYERITDREISEVLELRLRDAGETKRLAHAVEMCADFGSLRIYNADVPPPQTYLYEHDLFPLASCEVSQEAGHLRWRLHDDVWSCDYALPTLRMSEIRTVSRREGAIPRVTDPIQAIKVSYGEEEITLDGGSEEDRLLALVETVREADPDLVLTGDGDTFLLPHLIARAERNGLQGELTLDRDSTVLKVPDRPGTSYFSYGKIHFKPSAIKLFGRVHLDMSNSFAFSNTGMDGLFELSRICRLPLQTASRASIGKALSSLQFYHATQRDLLIPWKPALAERWKSRSELMVADRGGLVFEPEMGVHEGIAELDFASLYPNVMSKKNISAETVECGCCPESTNIVPELGWRVCQKRKGIVPTSMEIIVRKRLKYKQMRKVSAKAESERYEERQAMLKWVGVCSFGYLGFNNAKFGRIDAHIAVCAWDRKVLLDAARVAERNGFRVVHGIVDSLWLRREGARRSDCEGLGREIEAATGFEISFEGTYKWIVFLQSKVNSRLPVLNAYFGAFDDGRLKVRGIAARRHDTPTAFSACQMEVLSLMAEADSARQVRLTIPECVGVFLDYARRIRSQEIPVEEMTFRRNLSKGPDEYVNRSLEASVARQLTREGVDLHAGEGIEYLITGYSRSSRRAVALDSIDGQVAYDAARYVELLADACSTVMEPFDQRFTKEKLMSVLRQSGSGPL
jgi:DNA polymerase, archaea type